MTIRKSQSTGWGHRPDQCQAIILPSQVVPESDHYVAYVMTETAHSVMKCGELINCKSLAYSNLAFPQQLSPAIPM
jgi:hypothetical protein